MTNINPYTGAPYQGGVYESEPSCVMPEAHAAFYRSLWKDKTLTQRFNIERHIWTYPIWPKVNITFLPENRP